jgi:hypothetical protein
MRGITETIDTKSARISGFAIGTITDQSPTKQRRNLDIIVTVRQMKTESCIGDSEFRITTINGVTGKARPVAQIFPVRSTISAVAVGPTKPRNANTIADFKLRINPLVHIFHVTNDLMPGYQRQFGFGQLAIDHVKISAAHRARSNSHQQLSPSRSRFLHFAELERLLRLIQNHCAHGLSDLLLAPALAHTHALRYCLRARARA